MVCIVLSYSVANKHQEIENMAKEFETVNAAGCITPTFDFDDSSHPSLIRFDQFYQKLRLILSRNPSTSTKHRQEAPLHTTPPTPIVSPLAIPTTPPPSQNLVNPHYSSASNVTASSAAESTDEHFTQSLANIFVYGSYRSLLKSLNSIAWYRETNYKLQHEYAPKDIWLIPGTSKKCM